MIIGVFGLSGVGKSRLVSEVILSRKDVHGVSASKLISNYHGVVNFEKLDQTKIDDNQNKLLIALRNYKEKNKSHLLLEMHNLIETPAGLIFIKKDIFDSMSLDAACFIYKKPELILKNRNDDVRKGRFKSDAKSIDANQQASIENFKDAFKNIKHKIIRNHHLENIKKFIDDMISISS